MVIMTILQRAAPSRDFLQTALVEHGSRTREGVYKGVLFLFLDVVICVALIAGVSDNVAQIHFSFFLAHSLHLRTFGIDGAWSEFSA